MLSTAWFCDVLRSLLAALYESIITMKIRRQTCVFRTSVCVKLHLRITPTHLCCRPQLTDAYDWLREREGGSVRMPLPPWEHGHFSSLGFKTRHFRTLSQFLCYCISSSPVSFTSPYFPSSYFWLLICSFPAKKINKRARTSAVFAHTTPALWASHSVPSTV